MSKRKKLRPPIKTHGGKWYLTDFIIENFPEGYDKMTYCEPFCGGASVFLNKPPSTQEVINDIDHGTVSIFKSLRDEPKEFIDRLKKIKYTEKSFQNALKASTEAITDYVEKALNEYVLRRMSRGGMKKAFAWSERERGGKPGDVNAWETMIAELPLLAERVKDSIILNKSFFDICKVWDETDTFFYLDPPYLHVTRSENAREVYDHELNVEEHMNLLEFAKTARGKIMISGYSSPLYNRTLKGWKTKKKNVANNSGQGKVKERRMEVLWMNY